MERRDFLATLASTVLSLGCAGSITSLSNISTSSENLMPLFFIGHGSPINVTQQNPFTTFLKTLPEYIEQPKAILVISAHWQTNGTKITSKSRPELIFDYYGYPRSCYNIIYPAQGSPEIARTIQGYSAEIMLDMNYGLDHGSWMIARQMYPEAEIPILQLSIDYNKTLSEHYYLAQKLQSLRKQKILIIASGNLVHNLSKIKPSQDDKPYIWASDFDEKISQEVLASNHKYFLEIDLDNPLLKLSHPTTDHLVPLMYALGLQGNSIATSIYNQISFGSLSMRSFRFG